MKTRCPGCQTTFRVSPEQLKARAGKVRCGQCQTVFNALDSLLDEASAVTPTPAPTQSQLDPVLESTSPAAVDVKTNQPHPATEQPENIPDDGSNGEMEEPQAAAEDDLSAELPADAEPLSEIDIQALGKASGLILPRETTEIPGYNKWAEGGMTSNISLPPEKSARWPFVIAALLLFLLLAGQLVFHFRSEIAITTPSLRPFLEVLCQSLGADLPLPRHAELVSIETSDLQTDPNRGKLLVLNATLRNRANYEQAFPFLELSLTDTQDTVIARRVFPPAEYLPPKIATDHAFAINSDVAIRLWIETTDIAAAGYRLYVFYP